MAPTELSGSPFSTVSGVWTSWVIAVWDWRATLESMNIKKARADGPISSSWRAQPRYAVLQPRSPLHERTRLPSIGEPSRVLEAYFEDYYRNLPLKTKS